MSDAKSDNPVRPGTLDELMRVPEIAEKAREHLKKREEATAYLSSLGGAEFTGEVLDKVITSAITLGCVKLICVDTYPRIVSISPSNGIILVGSELYSSWREYQVFDAQQPTQKRGEPN